MDQAESCNLGCLTVRGLPCIPCGMAAVSGRPEASTTLQVIESCSNPKSANQSLLCVSPVSLIVGVFDALQQVSSRLRTL